MKCHTKIRTNLIRQSIVCFCQVGHDGTIQHFSAINKPKKRKKERKAECQMLTVEQEALMTFGISGENKSEREKNEKKFLATI